MPPTNNGATMYTIHNANNATPSRSDNFAPTVKALRAAGHGELMDAIVDMSSFIANMNRGEWACGFGELIKATWEIAQGEDAAEVAPLQAAIRAELAKVGWRVVKAAGSSLRTVDV